MGIKAIRFLGKNIQSILFGYLIVLNKKPYLPAIISIVDVGGLSCAIDHTNFRSWSLGKADRFYKLCLSLYSFRRNPVSNSLLGRILYPEINATDAVSNKYSLLSLIFIIVFFDGTKGCG